MTQPSSESDRRPQTLTQPAPEVEENVWSVTRLLTALLYHTDSLVYVLVGICFFAAALMSLGYGIAKFWLVLSQSGLASLIASGDAAQAIINFVSDLLLTLIVMEVLGTVVHYLRTRETSLKPFLFIGIVSATRSILAVGARLSIAGTGQLSPEDFRRAMIELGVDAAVIIALGITMRLIGHFLEDHTAGKSGHPVPLDTIVE